MPLIPLDDEAVVGCIACGAVVIVVGVHDAVVSHRSGRRGEGIDVGQDRTGELGGIPEVARACAVVI